MLRILSPIEKFAIHALLFHCDGESIDIAYQITRRHPTKATDPDIIHKMALRWLHDDESVNHYIRSLGYRAELNESGEKTFCRDFDSEIYKV